MRRSSLVSGGGTEGQVVQGHLQNFDMPKMWTKSQKNWAKKFPHFLRILMKVNFFAK